jgi:hypothetical protein
LAATEANAFPPLALTWNQEKASFLPFIVEHRNISGDCGLRNDKQPSSDHVEFVFSSLPGHQEEIRKMQPTAALSCMLYKAHSTARTGSGTEADV